MKKILILLLLIITTNSYSQVKTKKVSVYSAEEMIKEQYSVLSDLEFIKHGFYKMYFNKNLITEGFYNNDKKDSLWKYNMELSGIKFYGYYKNDLKEGEWVYFNNNTLLSKIIYSNDTIVNAVSYHNKIKLTETVYYSPGNGKCTKYYPNGNKRIEYFLKNNKYDSIATVFFPNGKLHRIIEMKNNEVFTCIETFDISGNKIDGGNLKNGNGKYIQYYFDNTGIKDKVFSSKTIANFENGIINGNYSEYDEKNNLLEEGEYINAQKNGKWYELKRKDSPYYNYLADTTEIGQYNLGLDFYNFSLFEEAPVFQDSDEARIKLMMFNTIYPQSARENGVAGTVYVSFKISLIGEIQDIKILRGVSKDLDKEVIRVVSLMPGFSPGFSDGMPVRVQFNMPFKFTLN